MADKKISELTASTTPLAGTEVLPVVQSGVSKKVSVDNLTAGKSVPASKVVVADGTDALPALTFSSDLNTGVYRVGADQLGIATNAVERISVGAKTTVDKCHIPAQGNGSLHGVVPFWSKRGLATVDATNDIGTFPLLYFGKGLSLADITTNYILGSINFHGTTNGTNDYALASAIQSIADSGSWHAGANRRAAVRIMVGAAASTEAFRVTSAGDVKVNIGNLVIDTAGKGIDFSGGVLWRTGTGSPEGVVTASVGSMYTDVAGGAGTTLYVKESGTGNTGWVAK